MARRNGIREPTGDSASAGWWESTDPDQAAGTYGLLTAARGYSRRPGPQSFALARSQAYIFVAVGVCGFVVLAFPHPPEFSEAAMALLGLVAIVSGIALYAGARRIPPWVLVLTPALGTLLASGAVLLSGSAVSAYTLYFLWIGFYCAYILPRAQALAQLAFILANFIVALAIVGIPAAPLEHANVSFFVLATGTIASAGLMLIFLRGRVERLLGELSGAARTDPLTRLPNRRAFRETLDAELERSHGSSRPLSVLAADVDRLEAINAELGHDGGDRALIEVGELLDASTRRMDVVARVGPGAFNVILPEVEEGEAYVKAEELLTSVRRELRHRCRAAVTISIGVTSYPRRAANAEGLLRSADRALFTAKVLGRDRAVVSSPEVEELLRGTPRRPGGESLTHLKTLLSLAEALDLRHSSTAHHAEAVGWYAERIARELGMSAPRVARVRLAGILHDIGKVGVPDAILFKPGPLYEGERAQMERHPEIGARILGSSELSDIREWVLCSHERLDGKGYPRGLSADEIPIEARIVAVADAFEAMRSDRIYRPGIQDSAVRDELRREVGKRFDPEVVEALFAVVDRDAETIEREVGLRTSD